MIQAIIYLYTFAIVFSFGYLLLAAITTRRAMRRTSTQQPVGFNPYVTGGYPPMTILKPIKGLDDQLGQNLESFFVQNYPQFEIIFGLQSLNDPALLIVRTMCKKYPGIPTKILINSFERGLNPKINNLINMLPDASYDHLLISDSNTRVKPDYLREIVRALQDEGVGLVTSTIRGIGAKDSIALMENMHLNTFVSPSVFVAADVIDLPIVIGKSMLLKKSTLEMIGGFAAFKDHMAEDYLIGMQIRKLGFSIRTINSFVDNFNEHWTLKKFLNRHTRWAKMRRHLHVIYYLMESLSNPVALSLILAIVLHNWSGILQLTAVAGLKMIYDAYILKIMDSDIRWRYLGIGIVKDVIIGLIWFVPFISYKVKWRKNQMSISKNSVLKPITQYNLYSTTKGDIL